MFTRNISSCACSFGRHTSQQPINVSLEPEGVSALEDISVCTTCRASWCLLLSLLLAESVSQRLFREFQNRMRRRVLDGAGMTSEHNLQAYQEDDDLIELWLWLDGVSNPTVWLHGISGQAAESQEHKIIGVRDALAFSDTSFMGYGGGFSDVGKLGIPTYAASLTLGGLLPMLACLSVLVMLIGRVVRWSPLSLSRFESSLQRSLAIRLCGWIEIDGDDAALNAKLDPMEDNNEFQRAAAIAIFHQNIPRAIHSLTVVRASMPLGNAAPLVLGLPSPVALLCCFHSI